MNARALAISLCVCVQALVHSNRLFAGPPPSNTRTLSAKPKREAKPAQATTTRGRAATRKPPWQGQAHGTLLLVGGTVHVGNGRVIEQGSILVVDGIIRQLGSGQLAAGTDAKRIDIVGKHVTPGLIAADTSLGLVEITGERSTRDDERKDSHPVRAGYDAATAINADSSLIQVNATEGITSAAVAPSGGLLSGQVAFIDLVYGDHHHIVSVPRVAVDGSLGQTVADSRAATFAKLREVLKDARLYLSQSGAYDRRALRDLAAHPLDLAALAPVLARRIPLTLTAERASDILGALALARDENVRIVIVGGGEAWKVSNALAAAKVAVVLQPSENLPHSFDTLGARLDNAALLTAAGVDVIISIFGEPHNVRNIRQEAGIAVAYGMDRERALASVTSNVARAYGVDDLYGTLEVGKVANIVVWDGDPFELSTSPAHVLIRGRVIAPRSRQDLLTERYKHLRAFRP